MDDTTLDDTGLNACVFASDVTHYNSLSISSR